MSGIAYSAIMLGVLLPKLNIWMTKRGKYNKESAQTIENANNITFKSGFVSMEEFAKRTNAKDTK